MLLTLLTLLLLLTGKEFLNTCPRGPPRCSREGGPGSFCSSSRCWPSAETFVRKGLFTFAIETVRFNTLKRCATANNKVKNHGQTSANRIEPGPEFSTLEVAMCMSCTHTAINQNCPNSAQTTFRFSPVRYRTPRKN